MVRKGVFEEKECLIASVQLCGGFRFFSIFLRSHYHLQSSFLRAGGRLYRKFLSVQSFLRMPYFHDVSFKKPIVLQSFVKPVSVQISNGLDIDPKPASLTNVTKCIFTYEIDSEEQRVKVVQ